MNWPEFVKRLLLEDGRIGERETALLRRAILGDRTVDREEAAFLVDLKRAAVAVHPDFDRFLFGVIKRAILINSAISDNEARWLRKLLLTDHQVGAVEVRFLEELRRDTTSAGPEFQKLCKEFLDTPAARTGGS